MLSGKLEQLPAHKMGKFENVVGGKLKLKGAAIEKKEKKKKKKKKKKRMMTRQRSENTSS